MSYQFLINWIISYFLMMVYMLYVGVKKDNRYKNNFNQFGFLIVLVIFGLTVTFTIAGFLTLFQNAF